jgi:protocatechuate 4,5-dioxygenase, beta chain
MARIVGGLTTSHIPAIGNAVPREKELFNDPYWKPFFAGYPPARAWLEKAKPDVAVVIYNDHGLNFFLDKMPTFSIGAASQYENADEGWGIPKTPPFRGDPELSWHIIESLVKDEFDVTSCQEMLVDHGFTVPMSLFWPGNSYGGVKTIPVCINTVQHPLPSPLRCFKLGQAIGRAVAAYEEDLKVMVFGTGGMSHQLQGPRAGLINAAFDAAFLDRLIADPEGQAAVPHIDYIREAGSEAIELVMWLVMRGALAPRVRELRRFYHVPASNTAVGHLILENAA